MGHACPGCNAIQPGPHAKWCLWPERPYVAARLMVKRPVDEYLERTDSLGRIKGAERLAAGMRLDQTGDADNKERYDGDGMTDRWTIYGEGRVSFGSPDECHIDGIEVMRVSEHEKVVEELREDLRAALAAPSGDESAEAYGRGYSSGYSDGVGDG
jgi:hypothetical protein